MSNVVPSFKNLNEAKRIIEDSRALHSFHETYERNTSSANIDKYNKGFNLDSRFKSFSVQVYFSAYMGAYGSRSVGSALRLDSDKVGNALIKYLNNNEEAVIKGIASILMSEAKDIVCYAKEELAIANRQLDDIQNMKDYGDERL